MNLKSYKHKLGLFILAIMLVPGIGLLSGSAAQAQRLGGRRRVVIVRPFWPYRAHRPFGWYGYRYPFGYPSAYETYYNQYVFDNSEVAAASGYKQGKKTGADDGKKHKSYSPERSHYFHDAGFGNYAESYRQGFALGYREGFQTQLADQR